jgi:hypothetical protein
LEFIVKFAVHRRYSFVSMIVAGLLAVGGLQEARAQRLATNQPNVGQAASGELKTLAVVAGARYEKLLSDLTALGPMIGRPEAGPLLEMVITGYTNGKAATALDRTKPWGIIVQTDGAKFYPIACLPIAKPDEVLEVARARGLDVKPGENGTTELQLPGGRTVYLKSQNEIVFLSITPASLSRLPLNSQEVLGQMVEDYDLTATVWVKNIPEFHRQLALQMIRAGLESGMKKSSDETDAQFSERRRAANANFEQAAQLINEVDSVRLGWAIDAQRRRTYLDFSYHVVPGSKLAQGITAYANSRTNFAGFFQPDAAAAFSGTLNGDPKTIADDLAQLESMIRGAHEELKRAIEKSDNLGHAQARSALTSAADDFYDALVSTIKSGKIDGGSSLRISPNSFTFAAGMHVNDAARFETGLKKLEAAKGLPDSPIQSVQWNVANHSGVNFHAISLDASKCGDLGRFASGPVNVTVGIGPDAVYLGIGQNGMEALGNAIDVSNAERGKAAPPVQFELALGPIMESLASQKKDLPQGSAIQAVADMVKKHFPGQDHIRAIGQAVPNGVSYRFEAEEGALRVVGAAAAQGRHAAIRRGN